MADLVETWLAEIDAVLKAGKGVAFGAPVPPEAWREAEKALGGDLPPGWKAFLARHDGVTVDSDTRLLSLAEALAGHRELRADEALKGLVPIMRSGAERFALDPEAADDPEWPIVALGDRGVERCATSFLRFIRVRLAMDAAAARGASPRELLQIACEADPGHADHWLDLADLHAREGQEDMALSTLWTGARTATPPSPSLCTALAGMHLGAATFAEAVPPLLDDALALDPLTTRDEDARLDALAFRALLAHDRGDADATAAARSGLGEALSSTAAFWRLEAAAATAQGRPQRASLAVRVLRVLDPDDRDADRLVALLGSTGAREGATALWDAREALDAGRADDAGRKARAALKLAPDLGLAHALLAEALNALHEQGALAAALRATELNPALVDGWRELGEAYLEANDVPRAEAAFRQVVARDPSFALGHARLAQALLAAGKPIQALDAIQVAADKGADAYVVATARGDIYAEMERHDDAAEAYDEALLFDPEDHFTLHQAALEHDRAGHAVRAADLFEKALAEGNHGCPQTHIDYGDLLRRMGRIGDAVRQLRKGVAAMPADHEWRDMLREAEKELKAAPN